MTWKQVPRSMRPKGCQGIYVPWVCGFCTVKQSCRPKNVQRYETKRKA